MGDIPIHSHDDLGVSLFFISIAGGRLRDQARSVFGAAVRRLYDIEI
jgi:hypothetical protein